MAHSFIQVPPDSTGKKVRHTALLDMELTNILVELNVLLTDEVVVGATSGATGLYRGYHKDFNEAYIYIHVQTGTFVVNEVISVGGVDVGTSETSANQMTTNMVLSDPDTPLHTQKVSHNGAAHIRFNEGNQLFDSWGRTQTSTVSIMGSFNFIYQDQGARAFYDNTVGGGTITPTTSTSTLTITTDTASGSLATRSTHQYYPYVPGEGNEWRAYMQVGGTGATNVVKRFGVFDDDNGMFFEQNGTDWNVVIRSSVGGTVSNRKVLIDDFNGSPVDVAGSPFVLDPSNFNLYWIDYAGVAKVRFGVFTPYGERVTIHTFQDLNKFSLPVIKTSTLPIRFELRNDGITSSANEMKVASTSISRQSPIQDYFGKTYSTLSPRTAISGSTTPVFAVRPKLTQGGFTNRITFQPQDLEWTVEGDPCIVEIYIGGVLTGATFLDNVDTTSAAQIDTTSTSIIGGGVFEKLFINGGQHVRELATDLSLSIGLGGDGITPTELAITARTVNPAGNATVSMILRWKELH